LVEVSGTNQYKVKPLALVRTATPPILPVFSVLLLLAAGPLEAGAAVPEPVVVEELPQAVIKTTAASPAGASHLLFMAYPRLRRKPLAYLDQRG
jgi:hypothetical protein